MNYYNEHDSKAAAWLRELIARGLIPAGIVDERSIIDVRADELREYTQCHFFAGIGGWSLALQLAGWPADRPVWTGSCPCQPFSSAGKGLAQADERHLWPVFFDLIRQCRPEHVFGEQVASAIGHGWLDGISADLEAEGYACGATVLGAHSVQSPHQRQRLYWVAHHHHQGSQGWERGELPECADKRFAGAGSSSSPLANNQGSEHPRQRAIEGGQQGGPANGSRLVLPNSDGCSAGSPATTPAGHGDTIEPASFWTDSQLVRCRDGKTRRIPSGQSIEPVLQRVVDGFPGSLDNSRAILDAVLGFPLSEGIRGRVSLLKGYGNAIVPQVAAEFIRAFYEIKYAY